MGNAAVGKALKTLLTLKRSSKMNATDKALKKNINQFIGKEAQLDEDALKPFANSRKVYVQGSTSDIQVPFREISISDTPS